MGFRKTVSMLTILLCGALVSSSAIAERANRFEASFALLGNGSEAASGENGSQVEVDSEIGWGFGLAYNFSEKLNLAFDFAYIDADKTGYRGYVETCQALVRAGGLIMLDNVLWGGSVADPADQEADTVALRELNAWLHEAAPGNFDLSLIPIGDGLTVIRRI